MSTVSSHARKPLGVRIGRIVLIVLAALVVLATIAATFLVWTVQRSFPQTSGELTVKGISADVSVQRDERGVPTITADNTDDLFFAEGFVHAQDRFFEMDFRRHLTSGRLSELFGESQAGTDAFLRTLGWREIAEREVENLDEKTRSYFDAYAAGVNAYLKDHTGADASLEYAVLDLQNPGYEPEPWTAADSVAWLKAMAWDLRTNINDETARATVAAQLDPETAAETMDLLYPGYPYDRNPVIVPQITPKSALPTAEDVVEEGDVDAEVSSSDDADDKADASAPTEQTDIVAAAAPSTVTWNTASNVAEAVDLMIGGGSEGIGSNSWVVSGDLTESGMPLLANDPHLGASLPSVWYQVQLKCSTVSEECPFDVGGFSFSGLPGVVIGHNGDIAWGFTNLSADVTDLYIERIQGDKYWRDGKLEPLEVREETIKVAGGKDIPLTIRSTAHGPIISDANADYAAIAKNPMLEGRNGDPTPATEASDLPKGDGEFAVSLRWTALDEGTTASAIFTLNTAKNFVDFRKAAAQFTVPAQNLIYADTLGNIGYQSPGKLPLRNEGEGTLPQPGWDSDYDWSGFIPFADLPVSYNPEQGYIVTANNAVVDEDYDYFLTADWADGYRAGRIAHLIERRAAAAPLTAQDLRDIQLDDEMWIGKQLAIAMDDVTVPKRVRPAVELLRTWDAQNEPDSGPAAYANVFWKNLVKNVFLERDVPLPVSQGRMFTIVGAMLDDPEHPFWTNDALGVSGMEDMLAQSAEDAYDELVELQGSDTRMWSWGSLHALTLTHQTLGTSGISVIEKLFNRGPYAVGGGSSVVNATGWALDGDSYATTTVPSMRMVVDLSNLDASTWNHLTGASGHAYNPHYTDQADDWTQGAQSPWPFSADAITQATVDTLTLKPAG